MAQQESSREVQEIWELFRAVAKHCKINYDLL